jgi:hypothetical protein
MLIVEPLNSIVWEDTMSETDSQANREIDCEVSVYEGSWATCDMGPAEEDDDEDKD